MDAMPWMLGWRQQRKGHCEGARSCCEVLQERAGREEQRAGYMVVSESGARCFTGISDAGPLASRPGIWSHVHGKGPVRLGLTGEGAGRRREGAVTVG